MINEERNMLVITAHIWADVYEGREYFFFAIN